MSGKAYLVDRRRQERARDAVIRSQNEFIRVV